MNKLIREIDSIISQKAIVSKFGTTFGVENLNYDDKKSLLNLLFDEDEKAREAIEDRIDEIIQERLDDLDLYGGLRKIIHKDNGEFTLHL